MAKPRVEVSGYCVKCKQDRKLRNLYKLGPYSYSQLMGICTVCGCGVKVKE